MSSTSTSNTTNAQTPRTKTGCQNCRIRHLKCDERRPSCVRCEKSGIECVRGYNIRFRHGANPSVANLKGSGLAKTEYDFSTKQTWVKTAKTLTFLDETPELINIYDHEPNEDDPAPNPFRWTNATPHNQAQAQTEHHEPSLGNQLLNDGSIGIITNSKHREVQRPFVITGAVHDQPPHGSPSAQSDRPEPPQFPWPSTATTTSSPAAIESNAFHSPLLGQVYSPQPQSARSPQDHVVKRRRLTFESSYQSSTASESPSNHLLNCSPADSWHTGWTPSATVDNLTSHSNLDLSTLAGLETTVSNSLSRIYLETPIWPLQDREEAKLLRHYVDTLSNNFDLTDPLKHFRQVVPQRAAVCPTLMNAIFAVSARHLSRIGEYDPLVSNKYHQECLKHLIPMLDDPSAILDENLLASTIILRHLEEFEVPISGQLPADQHSHLLGAQAFITAQERAAVTGGLRQAAFWVGLRQEVYVAFVNQRPVLPALEHCNIDRSFDAAEDHVWACRMVVLCADVIRYCFGDGPHSVASFKYAEDQVEQWYTSKPPTFTPVFHQEAKGSEIFPELWYVADEHATGIQHYHLARILLSSHNPNIPRLGPGRAAALRKMDEEIMLSVKTLCGMALSNPRNAPGFTYASMAVTMAGDKFTHRHEQEKLLAVLDQCDKMHAWPTGLAITNLKSAWGWEETANYV